MFGPNESPRWYTENPFSVRVPLKLVLHTGFDMPLATAQKFTGGKIQMAMDALTKKARILPEEDHELTMEELRARDIAEDE